MDSYAPEMRRSQEVSAKIDVYNFGCMVNEIMSGEESAFKSKNDDIFIWDDPSYRKYKPTVRNDLPDGMFFI